VWRHAATQGRVELGRWHRACDREFIPQCGEQKEESARGHAKRHGLSSTRVPGFCGLSVAHEHVPFDATKCSVDVFEGLASLASPRQGRNNLSRAGMGGLVHPRERGRQRATAGVLNHRRPARAVHARSCGPSPRRPGRSLRAERLVQQRLAADCLQPALLRRSGFRQQLKAGVGLQKSEARHA
jgi:hypothetical protein